MQGCRIDNGVIDKRSVGPVSLQLDYGAGEQAGGGTRGSTFGGGIMYSKDGLGLGASWAAGKATTYIGRMGHHESAGDACVLISYIGLRHQF